MSRTSNGTAPGAMVVCLAPVGSNQTCVGPGPFFRSKGRQTPTFAFVLLDALPLTPNGKLDRHALPAPDRARPELAGPPLAPRSHTEEVVAGIWAEVLGLEGIGVSDNFLDLGGHSLKATQVMSPVREAFHVELPVHSVSAQTGSQPQPPLSSDVQFP